MDLPTSHVFMRADARKIDPTSVKGLMASIEEVGIINPLRVRPVRRHVNGELTDAWEVTAGGHRLRAAIKLGLETVPCIVVSDDDLHAELAMIDENLCRAELSPAERARQTARRKELYLALHPETKAGTAGATARWDASANLAPAFTAATAEVIGISERAVQRDAERGQRVAPEVLDRIAGTHLDTGTYLDTLKKLGPKEQMARVQRALAQSPPARRAKQPLDEDDAREAWLATGMSWWNRGSQTWREEFLARIDEPGIDRESA